MLGMMAAIVMPAVFVLILAVAVKIHRMESLKELPRKSHPAFANNEQSWFSYVSIGKAEH